MPFTDKQIAALKPKSKRYGKKEPGRTGLEIRVTPRGQKTWNWTYRPAPGAKQVRMTLGEYPLMTVAGAHKAIAEAREKLKRGIDPGADLAAERQAEREAETLAELVDEYLSYHARPTMKASTAAEDERLLKREILCDPVLAKCKAKDISRRQLILALRRVEARGAVVLRNRVAGVLSRLFMFALDQGVIDASPAVGIKRLKEAPRDRYLSKEEIRAFWNGLDQADMTPQVRLALRLAIVLGQRRAEIAGAARAEIDDQECLWRLPAERAKNGRAHLIPLPPLAMRLIAEADQHRVRPKTVRDTKGLTTYDPTPSPWLFPSWHKGKPIEPEALTRALNRNRDRLGIGDATVHDLRRTFATWHGDSDNGVGTAPEVLSALLNHAPATITKQVYDRSENIGPRRKAMIAWSNWLERTVSPDADQSANVVPFKAAAE